MEQTSNDKGNSYGCREAVIDLLMLSMGMVPLLGALIAAAFMKHSSDEHVKNNYSGASRVWNTSVIILLYQPVYIILSVWYV